MKAYAKVDSIIVPIMLLGGATAIGSNRVNSRDPTLNAIERAVSTYSRKAPNVPKHTQASNGVDHNTFEYETNGHIVRTTMSYTGAPILRREQLKHLNYTVPTPRVEDLPILAFHSNIYDSNDIFVKSVEQARRDNKLNKLLHELGFMIKTGSANTVQYKQAYDAIVSVCEQNEIPYKKRADRHDSWRRRQVKQYSRNNFKQNALASLGTIILEEDTAELPGDSKEHEEEFLEELKPVYEPISAETEVVFAEEEVAEIGRDITTFELESMLWEDELNENQATQGAINESN